MKILHPHLFGAPGYFDRFMRESQAGRGVDHPNVVRTLDADSAEVGGVALLFLVMEYVEGRTLRELLHELGTVPEALLREIAGQAASGLAAIHEAGVVHRDVKPENILITDDHRVRVMDLGVARRFDESGGITGEGLFVGSLSYAAPEQFGEGRVGPTADLYSLGVVLHELATGRNPFRHDRPMAAMRAHLQAVPPAVDERVPGISRFFARLVQALLQKDPGERPGSAAELREIVERGESSPWWADREREILEERPRRPEIPVRRETRLYGRDTDLEALGRAWERVRTGEGRMVLLTGEAGIGKTRLVDAFVEALNGDARVLYGSYAPSGGRGGLSRAVLDHLGVGDLEERLLTHLSDAPALAEAFGNLLSDRPVPGGREALSPEVLHTVFCRLMQTLAAEVPLVWIVEDLHFADRQSRAIVLSMARALPGHRVLLLGTTRPGIPEEELERFTGLPVTRHLPLARLTPEEVVRLLRDAFRGEALADRLGSKIAHKSDGVPFFVFEMIKGLQEGQSITELPDGTWVESEVVEEIEVPSAVRDLVEARIRDLMDEDRDLLDVASVAGYEFDPDLVARVLTRKRIEVLHRLGTIERRGGVVRSAGRLYRFDHHQIQEVVYGDIADARREELHALLAEAYADREDVDPADPESVPGEAAVFLVSHHLLGARPEAALPLLEAAEEQLDGTYRHEEMIRVADLALGKEGLLEPLQRMRFLRARAYAQSPLGRFAEMVASLEEATGLAAEVANPMEESRVRGLLVWAYGGTGQSELALASGRRALALAREAGDREAEMIALLYLGYAHSALAQYEEATEATERGIAICREIGDQREEGTLQANLGQILQYTGRLEESLESYRRSLDIARENGMRRSGALALGNVGSTQSMLGRLDEACESLEKSVELARGVGDRFAEMVNSGNLANVLQMLGRFAQTIDWQQRALLLAREAGTVLHEAIALLNFGNTHNMLGAAERARDLLEEALSILRSIGARREEAYALNGLGEVAVTTGDAGEATRLFGEALAIRREISYPSGIVDSSLSLGRLLASEGRVEEAREHLTAALAGGRKVGMPQFVVLASCELALLPGGDRAAAEAAYSESGARLRGHVDARAQYLLWRITSDPVHIEEAHRLLLDLRDHAPEEYRETIIENVPLHRDIVAAWRERQAAN